MLWKRSVFFIFLIAVLTAGCSDKTCLDSCQKKRGRCQTCTWCNDNERSTEKDIFFTGESLFWSSENAARNDARRNANRKISTYINTSIESTFEELTISEKTGDVQTIKVKILSKVKQTSKSTLRHTKAVNFCLEQKIQDGKTVYKYFVNVKMPKSTLNRYFTKAFRQHKRAALRQKELVSDNHCVHNINQAIDLLNQLEKKVLVQ